MIGIEVVNKNHGMLNKCLEMFSKLLGSPHTNNKSSKQLKIFQMNSAITLLHKVHDWLKMIVDRDE